MRVIGKDRTGCDACNPLDEIIARIEQLERRVVTIVARVQGIPPDGTGNVTLPTSDSVDGPLYGNTGVFAMSSEVKEAADDVHQYASAIADDVVVLQSDVEILTREVEALDPASVTALEQSVAALQQSVNRLSNTVAGYSAVIGDLEDQLPNKVNRSGDTMTGPLNVIDTATGSRNTQAVNGNRLQNDLDNYGPMARLVNAQTFQAPQTFKSIRLESPDYPLYLTYNQGVTTEEVSGNNASGLQFYGGDGTYLGRIAQIYNVTDKKASMDLRMNSIINSGRHCRLFIEEKEDGTFALSFWNGAIWNRLVQ